MSQQVFYTYTHTKSRIENGEELVVKDDKTAKTSPMNVLFSTISNLNPCSIYEVGCRLGANLLSLKYYLPTTKLSGCDISELYRAYGEQLFDLSTIHFNVRNILESTVNELKNEVVYTVNMLEKYVLIEQKLILLNMKKLATKYVVIMEDKLSEELIKYALSLGLTLLSNKDNIYVFKMPQKIEQGK